VRFITDLGKLDTSMLGVRQRADPTFQRKEGQNETAIDAKGFEVDFLRRQPEGDDPHPFRGSQAPARLAASRDRAQADRGRLADRRARRRRMIGSPPAFPPRR